jgi:hypothetical protein
VAPLKDYPAHAQRKQAVHESGFPFHHRVDYYPRGSLRTATHIEVKHQQLRAIELFVNDKRPFGSKAAVAGSHQTKIVALGHLDTQFFFVGIRARPLDQA